MYLVKVFWISPRRYFASIYVGYLPHEMLLSTDTIQELMPYVKWTSLHEE